MTPDPRAASQERPHDNHDGCNPYDEGHVAGKAGRSTPAEALDVERLSDFFHEEYWLDSPHRDRGAAEGSDCEVCWRSADRLITLLARLSPPNREADHE